MAGEMGQNMGKRTYWFAAHGRIILVFQDPCEVVLELCLLLSVSVFSPGITELWPNVSLLPPSLKLSPGSTLKK